MITCRDNIYTRWVNGPATRYEMALRVYSRFGTVLVCGKMNGKHYRILVSGAYHDMLLRNRSAIAGGA